MFFGENVYMMFYLVGVGVVEVGVSVVEVGIVIGGCGWDGLIVFGNYIWKWKILFWVNN